MAVALRVSVSTRPLRVFALLVSLEVLDLLMSVEGTGGSSVGSPDRRELPHGQRESQSGEAI